MPSSGPTSAASNRAKTKGTKRHAHERKSRPQRRAEELTEIDTLIKRIGEGAQFQSPPPTLFTQLPLSGRTLRALDEAHYLQLTDIQRCALPVALGGLDVIGAAKTGSGKTLAFLIPVLERLYREKWTVHDGLGALILSPTRELALQTFDVLRRIGKYHGLSAGLIIGGKELRAEQAAIARMNILVATPGRLLQHMDQTSVFDWSHLQMLILDEADRILDLGFSATIDAILEELPREGRQTMLFSATLMESLAERLGMHDPVTISVHATEGEATPVRLTQKYLVCGLEEKLDRLYSFIKSNLKARILVFLSSCKQVRFVYEAFCRLQPGVPLLHLHGRQKQAKRMTIFGEYCRRAGGACLFATDVAARGLDFPAVDWVVQVDCPEDVATYIHRVGRTARYDRAGEALLFLLPSEAPAMVSRLREAKVPITSLYGEGRAAPPAKRPIGGQLQALCSADAELKYLAQKALVSYVRSIYLHSKRDGNGHVFQVQALPMDAFAHSLGLANTPRLRFSGATSTAKNRNRQLAALEGAQAESEEASEHDHEHEHEEMEMETRKGASPVNEFDTTGGGLPKKEVVVRKIDRMFRKKNTNVLSAHYAKLRSDDDNGADDGSSEEELLRVRRKDHEIDAERETFVALPAATVKSTSRRQEILAKSKKHYARKHAESAKRLVFDEETGEAREAFPFTPESSFDKERAAELAASFVREELQQMRQKDQMDAERQREARRAQRIEKKRKAKETLRHAHLAKSPRIAINSDGDASE